jgi:acyl carrier protein
MSTRSTIESIMVAVATENNVPLVKLQDDLPLLDTGLDSLCLAVIVARLEDKLGVDPFNTTEEMAFPVTVGDFINIYETALG